MPIKLTVLNILVIDDTCGGWFSEPIWEHSVKYHWTIFTRFTIVVQHQGYSLKISLNNKIYQEVKFYELPATLSQILLTCVCKVAGQYDSLESTVIHAFPQRFATIRNSLLDPTVYEEAMFHLMSYVLPTDSANPKCANHSIELQMAFLEDQLWAIKMMDASTKLEPGVLAGRMQGLGNYDECLSVDAPSGQFQGQLCVVVTKDLLGKVRPGSKTHPQFVVIPDLAMELVFSTCVPSSCTPEDLQAHWHDVLAEFNASVSINPSDCSVKGDLQPKSSTWLALAVFAVLFLAVFISTCYDYSINHQPTKEKRILLCFSAYTNLRNLFNPPEQKDRLNMLDGLRIFAIYWIVLGHRFDFSLGFPTYSIINFEKYTTAWFMAPLLDMMLAVEIFFLLSGCLLTYHFLGARARGEAFNLVHFYYKRYMRLTPLFAAAMLLEGCVLLYMSEGPMWKRFVGFRANSCADYWWSSLLFISNYVNPYRVCLLQTWYLSMDMQLYVLAPLLLLPLSNHRRGLYLLAACYVATTAASFANAFYYQLPAGGVVTLTNKTQQNYGLEYVKTHVRAASWLTGVALGYILHTKRGWYQTCNMSKVTAAVCWFISVFLCLAAVYSIAPFQSLQYQYSPLLDSLHFALHRNAFSLGIAGVILLCYGSKGSWMKDLLSWRGFRPLATLSYGVYLTHMSIQTVNMARLQQPYVFDIHFMLVDFLSDLLLCNLVAILLYISVEAPFWEISRWLYSPGTVK